MATIDCTPPADLPDVVLIFNQVGQAFDLRWRTPGGVDAVRLAAATLPGAREEAAKLGHVPTAWVDSSGSISKFYTKA